MTTLTIYQTKNLIPCVICGQCRYDHDVIRAPRISSIKRIFEWKRVFRSGVIQLMQDFDYLDFHFCIEHFHPTDIDRNGKLWPCASPLPSFGKEKQFYENFFHDHGYSQLRKRSDLTSTPLGIVSCSLCSENVVRSDFFLHAKIHAPTFDEISDYSCEFHALNPLENEKIAGAVCKKCESEKSKALFESTRIEAKRCFPMFDFMIFEHKIDNKYTTYSADWRVTREYAANRVFLMDMPVLVDQSLVPQQLSEPVMEPLESLDSSPDPLQQPEGVLIKTEIKSEPVDADYEAVSTCREIDEEQFHYNDLKTEFEEFDGGVDESQGGGDENGDNEANKVDELMAERELEEFCQFSIQNHRLNEIYEWNKHPTFTAMMDVIEQARLKCGFKTIFQFYETERRLNDEKCPEEGDTCTLAREYLMMEPLPVTEVPMSEETKKRLEEEFEKHWQGRKAFSTGYSYVLAEKVGLAPKLLRKLFQEFQRKMVAKQAHESRIAKKEIKAFNLRVETLNKGLNDPMLAASSHVSVSRKKSVRNQKTRRFSSEVNELLELAYLEIEKRDPYFANDCEWLATWRSNQLATPYRTKLLTNKELSNVASRTGLSLAQVKKWIYDRRVRENTVNKAPLPVLRRNFTKGEREVLNAEFEKNPFPTYEVRRKLAETMNRTMIQVRQYFTNLRAKLRKENKFRVLENESKTIPKEKTDVLKQWLGAKKAYPSDRCRLAKQLGLSYPLVTHWLERNWKHQRKRTIRRESKESEDVEDSEDDKEEEEIEETDDGWFGRAQLQHSEVPVSEDQEVMDYSEFSWNYEGIEKEDNENHREFVVKVEDVDMKKEQDFDNF